MSKIQQLNDTNTIWCFVSEPNVTFDKRLFDLEWAQEQGVVTGKPEAGRGNTHFLTIDGTDFVLREYLRGGMVSRVNQRNYIWQGLEHTRAYKELQMLNTCIGKGLPVPAGYACKVVRNGMFYTASLITYKLDGVTMAQKLEAGLTSGQWQNIGSVIAQFHAQGIWHADLNAHNILINENNAVAVIDFDRAREHSPFAPPMDANINRLQRSVAKEARLHNYSVDNDGWAALLNAYQEGKSNAK